MRSGFLRKSGVGRKAPRITGVSKKTFQLSLQSPSSTFRHQSGPPPCSAATTTVLASLDPVMPSLAEPVAANVSAASATPANGQSLRFCIAAFLFDLEGQHCTLVGRVKSMLLQRAHRRARREFWQPMRYFLSARRAPAPLLGP